MNVEDAKARIVAARRRLIREGTYAYVIEAILNDTGWDAPFRDRMVIDWWSRIIDPLEAEGYDEMRLPYFRDRLKEHNRAPRVNPAIRQRLRRGKQLRRLNHRRLQYVKLQIRRLGDRRLNYLAAAEAVKRSDKAFEQLAIGFVGLGKFEPRSGGWLERIAGRVHGDPRFRAVADQLRRDSLPGIDGGEIAARLALISSPLDPQWLAGMSETYLDFMRAEGLRRKLEDKYINKIR